VVRHLASLILYHRRRSTIARPIDDGPRILSGPFCTSHSVPFIHCKTRLACPASRVWHRPIAYDISPAPGTIGKFDRADFAVFGNSEEESATERETQDFWRGVPIDLIISLPDEIRLGIASRRLVAF
jgi:hypothetical protein